MFTIKNAIKNVFRHKNKYIPFGVLYLIIILAASVCVNIFIQMEKATDNILKDYASVIKVVGRIYRSDEAGNIINMPTRLSKDEFVKYTDSQNAEVKFFRYNFATNFLKENVELERELNIDGETIPLGFPLLPVFVLGYNMSLLNLETDEFELESGRMFEKDDEAVIAKNKVRQESDTKNGLPNEWGSLDLGDKIIMRNDDGIYKEFTVVGIKEPNPADNINTNRQMIYTTLEGAAYFDIITPNRNEVYPITANNVNIPDELINMGYDMLIYLNSPENFIKIHRDMLDMGILVEPLFPNYSILINLTRNMQDWSIVFMILTVLIIISVTIISTLILLNNRKYEIAVLRSTGTKKSKLILNYLIENLIFIWGIAIISLIAAQFISGIFTGKVFTSMKDLVSVEMYASLTQGINIDTILPNIGLVFGGTTAVVILSLILACINIIRFEPLKIFNKQY